MLCYAGQAYDIEKTKHMRTFYASEYRLIIFQQIEHFISTFQYSSFYKDH
ncbi:hypothetical protein HMP0015_1214 [Acinetobacter haemolyticus ATCC 19194]|uniref:Uncharacterized protein n=1 Tax=Acinetobacter haemolyticus ATCC 19194 TaxID=707232 RepID=D4XNC2_ACIHA|nr:hypothetical protein HMP0015_1214 [Acinetobacter haemolyticus ATCC 19194]